MFHVLGDMEWVCEDVGALWFAGLLAFYGFAAAGTNDFNITIGFVDGTS